MLGKYSETSSLLSDLDKNKKIEEDGSAIASIKTKPSGSGGNHRLREIIKRHPETFYKGKGFHCMSNAAFQTILDEIALQKQEAANISKSYSAGDVIPLTGGVDNKKVIINNKLFIVIKQYFSNQNISTIQLKEHDYKTRTKSTLWGTSNDIYIWHAT